MICVEKFHAKGKHYVCSESTQETFIIQTPEFKLLSCFVDMRGDFERNPLDWLTKGYCVYNIGDIIQWIDCRMMDKPFTIPVAQYGDALGPCCLTENVIMSFNTLDLKGVVEVDELWALPYRDINCTIDVTGIPDKAALMIYMMICYYGDMEIIDDPERSDIMRTFAYIASGKDTRNEDIKLTQAAIAWLDMNYKFPVDNEVLYRIREVTE